MLVPAGAGLGDSVLVIARSATKTTVVVTEDVLFAVLESSWSDVTLAVLVIVGAPTPALGTWMVTVMPTPTPLERPPIGQVRVPAVLVHGIEVDTSETPAGRTSVTTTLVAPLGPLLVTAMLVSEVRSGGNCSRGCGLADGKIQGVTGREAERGYLCSPCRAEVWKD